MSPSLKALEILKNLPKDFFSTVSSEEKKDQKDEEKESFKSATEHESFREAFLKALNESGGNSISQNEGAQDGPLPPVLKHPLNAESLAKPFQEKLYGYEQHGSGSSQASSLWTPSLNRSKSQQSKVISGQSVSSWEIDTPYVGRNSRGLDTLSAAESGHKGMPPPPPPLPSAGDDSKKRKKKRRRRHSSSSSSSSSEDEVVKKTESAEAALERKKKILSKVWTLMAQKKKLEAQRDETVLNHKGDGKSLAVLLKENSTLSAEIDKQIFLMNQMVQTINESLGMSKTEAQQQEFFFQPSMYKDTKALQAPGKKSFSEKALQKSINKFLKPSEESTKRSSPPSPVRRSKRSARSRSRSRSRSRERKRSPSIERKVTKKHLHEKKIKREKSPIVEEPKPKKKKDFKKLMIPPKVKIEPKTEGEVEYAPSPAMKPHVKYIDQGTHWCNLCNDFLDTVPDYVGHLESGSHMEKLKIDAKPWLPTAPKIEKDPVDPNAPVLTIPLQGMEFIHSITAFYCSLCDSFIKTREEAQYHSETKMHVSKYKDHLSRNPMYEASYVREKMAAFAKYSVDKERRKEKNPSLEHMKSQDFFGEVKNKTSEDIADEEPVVSLPKGQESPPDDCATDCGMTNLSSSGNDQLSASSIRVACRSSISAAGSEEKCEREQLSYSDFISSNYVAPAEEIVKNLNADNGSSGERLERLGLEGRSLSEEEEMKLLALKKRVAEIKESAPSASQKPSHEYKRSTSRIDTESESLSRSPTPTSNKYLSESQQQSSKLHIKKYSNVIIGKMPFLKKTKGSQSVSKNSQESAKCQEGESPVVTEAEERIRQMLTEGFPTYGVREMENCAEALPATVPRNTEYITDIESCDDGTTFIKKFGPTLNPQGYSDDEDESQEAPMDISHDEESDKDEEYSQDNSQSVLDIPVPIDPLMHLQNPASPLESKLKVDMSSPHLSQLSAAAAMYKEAVAYHGGIPPASFMPMPPVPSMMNPPLYPPYPHPQSMLDDYCDGINPPPPPGTEEGSSNQSSVNPTSDGIDSPDSFLCQKTPPPPGTEDENIKVSEDLTPIANDPVIEAKPDGHEYFKEILADLPVKTYESAETEPEKDEGSQESLVQEGLELLEFADEDDEKSDEKLLRNKSPPPSASPPPAPRRSKRKAAMLAEENDISGKN